MNTHMQRPSVTVLLYVSCKSPSKDGLVGLLGYRGRTESSRTIVSYNLSWIMMMGVDRDWQ